VRNELARRVRAFTGSLAARASLDDDISAIHRYLGDVDRRANGAALFACSGAGRFEPFTFEAPLAEHLVHIGPQPHLYPLARLLDSYPRYVVLLADTHTARIIVVSGHAVCHTERIDNPKTKRHKMGGCSQARYQRHVDNLHLLHAKEAADALTRIVRDEAIPSLIVAGDEVILPLLRDQLPADVDTRIVVVLRLDVRTPDSEVLDATLPVMRAKDADADREQVDALLGESQASGRAVVGVPATRRALDLGQVDELVITAEPTTIRVPRPTTNGAKERAADELVVKARQTGATVRFVEETSLLARAGGVGAFLRFRL
jgi:peptide chain release factor subunit 1